MFGGFIVGMSVFAVRIHDGPRARQINLLLLLLLCIAERGFHQLSCWAWVARDISFVFSERKIL